MKISIPGLLLSLILTPSLIQSATPLQKTRYTQIKDATFTPLPANPTAIGDEYFQKALNGYQTFRKKYALGDKTVMQDLSREGQKPHLMIIACSDSRVDPAVILQCDPGELFVVRNVANIVPPYEKDGTYHGTSAALEFGINYLHIPHLIILGHSQCAGMQTLFESDNRTKNDDFITNWVSVVKLDTKHIHSTDEYTKKALQQSYKNCMTFPWIAERVKQNLLHIHIWFFDIKTGQIFTYSDKTKQYEPLG
ncbi:MAG TPA: carbonic anhydrase [Candidatus Babeliales bacterium]|nr:carbonic anhydrase [Candidatus Babeliales bacterium]